MLIVCPSCATSYNVEPVSLRSTGRRVRCVRCRTVWQAEPSRAEKLLAAADALGPGSEAAELAPEPVVERRAPPETMPSISAPPSAAAEQPPPAPPDDWAIADAADDAGAEPAAEGGESVAEDPESGPDAVVEVQSPPTAPVEPDPEPAPAHIDADLLEAPAAGVSGSVEKSAARRAQRNAVRPRWRWPMSRVQLAILALLIVDAILVGWRADVVRVWPQSASFYALIGMPVNLRGLVFERVTTTTEQHEGLPILVVEGNIVNKAGRLVDVPRIKLAVRNAARQEIYSWTAVPPRTMLPPGDSVSFRVRLASPPLDSRDVLVRFLTRRDILTGDR